MLDVKTVTFTVTRHIRPKKRCAKCSCIVQAPAPSRPIERSFAGASLLALVLTWKYGFHLPLYRQCQIFAHAGMTLSRTTLMQWVGASSQLLGPLVAALAKHVLAAKNLNADDTPIKVLAPGSGKTKRGHLWTYVRDGTAWGSTDPPAVWYQYSPSWHGKYPQKHLASFEGKLQVDAYAGFEPLFLPNEARGCGAHRGDFLHGAREETFFRGARRAGLPARQRGARAHRRSVSDRRSYPRQFACRSAWRHGNNTRCRCSKPCMPG